MVKVDVRSHAIVKILHLLAQNKEPSQGIIQEKTKLSYETLSRRLNQLEYIGLVEKTKTGKSNTWSSTFSGLYLIHVWAAVEDLKNPLIKKIADTHTEKWVVYQVYHELEKNPRVLEIINANTITHSPYPLWRTPRGLIDTYQQTADNVRRTRNSDNPIIKKYFGEISLKPSQKFINNVTRKVLGWDLFMENILYENLSGAFIEHLLRIPEIKTFYRLQAFYEDSRYVVLQTFKKNYLEVPQ